MWWWPQTGTSMLRSWGLWMMTWETYGSVQLKGLSLLALRQVRSTPCPSLLPPAVVNPVLAASAVAVAGAQPAAVAAPFQAGSLKWLYAETAHGRKYGQEVVGFGAALVRGDKQVFDTGGGKNIFFECVDGADLAGFLERPSACDKRILGQKLNPLGQPERSLQDVARDCVEEPVQWALTGPRTAKWCVSYLSIEGLGFQKPMPALGEFRSISRYLWPCARRFVLISWMPTTCWALRFSSEGSKPSNSLTQRRQRKLRAEQLGDACLWRSKLFLEEWLGSFQHWWFALSFWPMSRLKSRQKPHWRKTCTRPGRSVKPLARARSKVVAKQGRTPEMSGAPNAWPSGWRNTCRAKQW